MPLPRFDKLPEEKRRAILAAARTEFAAHGFDDASFNRIIAEAGVSKGAMYYYFADKADLYGAVCSDAFERVADRVRCSFSTPDSAESFWSSLSGGMAELMTLFLGDPELAALGRDFYRRAPSETFEQLQARVRGWVEEALAAGQELGAVRDDLPRDLLAEAVTGLLVAVDRWFADAMSRLSPERLEALARHTLELVRDLLEPRHDTGGTP